jgi:hypothetical protein
MSDDLTARLEAESYWETTDYGKLRVVPYSLAVAALTAERTAHVEDEQAADEAYRLQGRELKRHIDLHEAWVKWAQFVWLDGGPVTGTDKELRQAVCERHDTAVAAERTAREQAEQERDRAKAVLAEVVEWFGPWHGDSCPCDDTCACEVKPLNDRINAVLAALSPQDTPR